MSRPTFFGCDANLKTTNDTRAPIVLYLANTPYSSYTNYSEYSNAFSDEDMAVIMANSFNIVTLGNGGLDQEWPECLGCAVIDRSLVRSENQRTSQCQPCFGKYCWSGVVDNENPGIVDPIVALNTIWDYASWNKYAGENFWPGIGEHLGQRKRRCALIDALVKKSPTE
jgi:lysophospholipase